MLLTDTVKMILIFCGRFQNAWVFLVIWNSSVSIKWNAIKICGFSLSFSKNQAQQQKNIKMEMKNVIIFVYIELVNSFNYRKYLFSLTICIWYSRCSYPVSVLVYTLSTFLVHFFCTHFLKYFRFHFNAFSLFMFTFFPFHLYSNSWMMLHICFSHLLSYWNK